MIEDAALDDPQMLSDHNDDSLFAPHDLENMMDKARQTFKKKKKATVKKLNKSKNYYRNNLKAVYKGIIRLNTGKFEKPKEPYKYV